MTYCRVNNVEGQKTTKTATTWFQNDEGMMISTDEKLC
jgi:hypothetical protein